MTHRPLAVLHAFLAVTAIAGGIGLVATNGLGMEVSDLDGSPFGSFAVPGIALALLVGGPMAAAAATAWRGAFAWPALSAAAGAALLVFEVVEALSIGGVRSPLQVVMTALALFPLVAGLRGLRRLGATDEEVRAAYPGDDLVPCGRRHSVMATTIAVPPAELWPWLVQMGGDRAGFYSWDRLDNAGCASAERIHPEWQDLRAGDRIASVPDASRWFDVALLEEPRLLVLRASLSVPAARPFDPAAQPPRAFSDTTWGFYLSPAPGGATRLVVTGVGRCRPRALVGFADRVFWDPAHWIMQARQFAGLRRRAEGPARPRNGARPAASPAGA